MNILITNKAFKMNNISKAKDFDELLDLKYGKLGSKKRDEFEAKAKAFVIGEMIKEERKKAKITQEELARRSGTEKTFISKVENGKIDIQVSLLFKIFEKGLGKNIGFTIL